MVLERLLSPLTLQLLYRDLILFRPTLYPRTIFYQLYRQLSTVYWNRKGSTTTTGPTAYILRLASLHQRINRCVPKLDYIPGVLKVMADAASCAWHLNDTELLAHFNSKGLQKRNECISHAHSGNILCCSVKVAARQSTTRRTQHRQRNLPYDSKILSPPIIVQQNVSLSHLKSSHLPYMPMPFSPRQG